ncbi:MAG: homoaconitate hydratase [Deltaproteobacteria bacterium RIFOXYA12_FULL_58_15]|nr:MAG: homoaconitate hydratase [Deltaproteobacteria bacterium RIFOXYA12_FULL_58_15]
MGKTIIEKILKNHSDHEVECGQIADITIDSRVARDFGGANVVKNVRTAGLRIADPKKTFFTFDCNPGGSDQKYATNQQTCRTFARESGIKVFDIDGGIGTHIAIDQGLAIPGSTFVSTDSHANILGAIGAFGQGMGDLDVAHAFAHGRVWFKVPHSIQVSLRGRPSPQATAKDIVLAMVKHFGANGLLGFAAEIDGEIVPELSLSQRITIASMATEMGGIIALFVPNADVVLHCKHASGKEIEVITADPDAIYTDRVQVDIEGLVPQMARPGHPEDVVDATSVAGRKIDSVFIGSCTNGRMEDLRAAAEILKGRKVAPGVVLKIVPATDAVWRKCLDEGLFKVFKDAGALVGNAGCGGCAAGQIGQNGPGEVTVSTGNRNFAGKQGKGEVYLASPVVAAASAIAGEIALPDAIPQKPALFTGGRTSTANASANRTPENKSEKKPTQFVGRAWVIKEDNIDTDMIFHNSHLTVTDIAEMGQYAFGNLEGWKDFPNKSRPGDIVVVGKNFGAGSSRQQAVDCFASLGISLIIAESFGAIYERNAINAGFPILAADLTTTDIRNGDEIRVDLEQSEITLADAKKVKANPFSTVQLQIYQRGGLLAG